MHIIKDRELPLVTRTAKKGMLAYNSDLRTLYPGIVQTV